MVQAVRVHTRIAGASESEATLYEALDRAGLAAFAMSAGRCLMAHNRLADELLRAGQAIGLRGGTCVGPDACRRCIPPSRCHR